MLGRGKGFRNDKVIESVDDLRKSIEQTVFEYGLSPALRDAFEERYRHAVASGRDAERFVAEEEAALRDIADKAERRREKEEMRLQARQRRLAGETFADKVLDEYRQRIDHYPSLNVHPEADPEVSKLYGAMSLLDVRHWNVLETFLRRAFPQAGNLDRMNIEERFWRHVPVREGRLPAVLERYRQVLAAPSATNKEKVVECQECIKSAAFFLHDLLAVCERARGIADSDPEVDKAIEYINAMIADFRVKDLRRR